MVYAAMTVQTDGSSLAVFQQCTLFLSTCPSNCDKYLIKKGDKGKSYDQVVPCVQARAIRILSFNSWQMKSTFPTQLKASCSSSWHTKVYLGMLCFECTEELTECIIESVIEVSDETDGTDCLVGGGVK